MKANLLLIEDDDGKRYTVARLLRAHGYDVSEAATGAAALELVSSDVDVAVIDIKLPDISGFEVCRRLKASPETRPIMLLALSARYATADDRALGLILGADAYLVHPVETTELIATIEALLRIRRAERERSRLLATIEDSQRRNEIVTGTATVGLLLFDAEGRCTFMNPEAEKLTGWRLGEAEDNRQLLSELGRCVGGDAGVKDHRFDFTRRDGTSIPIACTANRFEASDGGASLVVEMKDVSALVAAERVRDMFISVLGHDLRSPLQVLQTGTSLIRGEVSEALNGVLQRMDSAIARMDRLITQLLDLAQARAGDWKLDRNEIDLAAIAESVVADAQLSAKRDDIQLVIEAHRRGRWDRDRIAQVVDNLVTNAIKHGAPEEPITVRVRGQGDRALLEVHNGGGPIPDAIARSLFDPFTNVGDRREGLGLGLYISREIVTAHGGEIELEQGARGGVTFRVVLPVESADRPSDRGAIASRHA
jgi:signal transduction histidine kinase